MSEPGDLVPVPQRHSLVEDVGGLVTGVLLVSVGLAMLVAASAVTGGTAGLSLLLHYATGWEFSLVFGAVNLPFTSFLTQAGPDAPALFKPRADLEAMFEAAGLVPGTRVVTYCHIGQQATVPYLVARMLGYEVRLYDGSFEEWSATPSAPVQK